MQKLGEISMISAATAERTGQLTPIGTPLGEIGSARPLAVSASLATMRPEETDQRVSAALKRISGEPPVFLTRRMFPENGPTYVLVESVRWNCPAEKLDEAARVVEGAFRSAPAESVGAALYKLRIRTRGREPRSAADHEAEAMIWIEDLRRYPGDIVLDVLNTWHCRDNGMWWPTWHEVEAELKKRQDRRMALANFIRRGLLKGTPEVDPPMLTVADVPGAGGRIAAHWDSERQKWEAAGHARPLGKRQQAPEQVARKAEAALDELRVMPLPQLSPGLVEATLAKMVRGEHDGIA
jgi:hypothetical protein